MHRTARTQPRGPFDTNTGQRRYIHHKAGCSPGRRGADEQHVALRHQISPGLLRRGEYLTRRILCRDEDLTVNECVDDLRRVDCAGFSCLGARAVPLGSPLGLRPLLRCGKIHPPSEVPSKFQGSSY